MSKADRKSSRDAPITSEELDGYIASQDDFALELYVYHSALSKGLTASHGGTYEDPITSKPRQFDVRIRARRETYMVSLAVECKSLRASFPLVVSRIPRSDSESVQYVIWARMESAAETTASRTPPLLRADGMLTWGKKCLYKPGEPVGKSTAQIQRTEQGNLKGGGDAEIYDKWTQALGSAGDLVSQAKHGYMGYGLTECFTIVLPVLVVADATLWVVDYATDGSRKKPTAVNETTLYVDRKYESKAGLSEFSLTHLHIYTKTGFDDLLAKLKSDARFWRRLFADLKGKTPTSPKPTSRMSTSKSGQ